MGKRIRRFALTDMVVWNREFYTTEVVEKMSTTYGEGPFKVIGLKLNEFDDKFVLVTVQTNIGPRDFAIHWFKKV